MQILFHGIIKGRLVRSRVTVFILSRSWELSLEQDADLLHVLASKSKGMSAVQIPVESTWDGVRCKIEIFAIV